MNIAVISYIRLVTEDLSFKSQYTAGREINKIKESSLNLNLKFLKNWFTVRLNHTNTCKIITLICSCKQKKKKKKGNYLNCARVGKTESGNMLIKLGKEDSGHTFKNIYFTSKIHLFFIFDDDDEDDEYRFRLQLCL